MSWEGELSDDTEMQTTQVKFNIFLLTILTS